MTHALTQIRPAVQELIAWLIDQGLRGTHYEVLLETLCHKLETAGVPLMRMNLSMRAYHPQYGAFAYRWKRADGLIHEQYERNPTIVTGWDQSPLKYALDNKLAEFRARVAPENEPFDFPVLYDLQEQGATDYFITLRGFFDPGKADDGGALPEGIMVSWTTDQPGGFNDSQIEDIRAILPALGLALKSNSNHEMAETLLSTYLGGDAGGRVLSGDITRGSVDRIEAVILYFDLQGFTKLSEVLPGEEIIAMLNDYFGTVVAVIEDHGGNVLKFMGDGLLAIFPHAGTVDAGMAALDTVTALRSDIAAINHRRASEGLTTTGFTAALHAGDVAYGNIGGTNRLDFTVIGPAVNTTARMSGMCSLVDQAIVISSRVARPALDRRPDLVSLGQYRLRGVTERQELFTLD